MGGRRSALLIATSSYEDQEFRQLQAPAADVAGLRSVLGDSGIGNYEVDLLSDRASYEVNRAIDEFLARANAEDQVLLYFSGHGYRELGNRLFLATRDSRFVFVNRERELLESTAVSAQFVRNRLERCSSRQKIVILDCCHAGAFPVGATKNSGNFDVLGEFAGWGSVVLTASSAVQYALERSGDEAFSEVGEKAVPSVFTGALIDGIATGKADLNGDGIIDFDELYKYVYDEVASKFPQQTPQKQVDVQGTLFIAKSPRGPRAMPLPSDFTQGLRWGSARARVEVINELVDYCAEAHPGIMLAGIRVLSGLKEDDSKMVTKAALKAADQLRQLAGPEAVRPQGDAAQADGESRRTSHAQQRETTSDRSVAEAQRTAEAIIADARSAAENLIAATEEDAAKLRASAERDVVQIRATARQEGERLAAAQKLINEAEQRALAAETRAVDASALAEQTRHNADQYARRLSDNAKKGPNQVIAEAMAQADEIRSQAQLILEESEAQRAQAEAEFEIQLAARREEAELQEAERLAAAQAATKKLVSEAEQRASTAEQRAAKASAQADQTRRDGDQYARQMVSNAKKNADQIVTLAKAQAEQMLGEADAERRRVASQREVEELTRQKDNISTHPAQVRQLLGDQLGVKATGKAVSGAEVRAEPAQRVSGHPEFAKVMRGYDPMQVDEHIERLIEHPSLPTPKFGAVMRGYEPAAVDRFIDSLRKQLLG